MKEILLTQGKVTRVDDWDYLALSRWTWFAFKDENGFWYAGRTENRRTVRMHRQLLLSDLFGKLVVDHEDNDGLNNQRYNLRACTRSENCQNQKLRSDNACGYKGVEWHPSTEKWRARIRVNQKQISLGLYHRIIDAATTYDAAALRYFGTFAKLNFSYDPACYI